MKPICALIPVIFLCFSIIVGQKKQSITEIKEWPKTEVLRYTVQIGLYSKPKMPGTFAPLDIVYEDKTPEQYYRYLYGIYMTYRDARKVRDRLRAGNFPDCFVRAYYGGSIIPIEQALKMETGDSIIDLKAYMEFYKREKQKEKEIVFGKGGGGGAVSGGGETPSGSVVSPSGDTYTMIIGPFTEGVPVRAVTFITSLLRDDQISYSATSEGVTMILKGVTPSQKELITTRLLGMGISKIQTKQP